MGPEFVLQGLQPRERLPDRLAWLFIEGRIRRCKIQPLLFGLEFFDAPR